MNRLPSQEDWDRLCELRKREKAREAGGALRLWTKASDELNRLVRAVLDGDRITGHNTDQG